MTSLFDEITAAEPDADVPVRRVSISVNGRKRTADIEPRLELPPGKGGDAPKHGSR